MSTTNELTKNYSGIFGNMIVAKNRNGKTIMTIPKTRPTLEPTEKQVNVRRKFQLAAHYAKTIVDTTGAEIEQGLCSFNPVTGKYDFIATVSVPDLTGATIIATATDTPGHSAELTLTL